MYKKSPFGNNYFVKYFWKEIFMKRIKFFALCALMVATMGLAVGCTSKDNGDNGNNNGVTDGTGTNGSDNNNTDGTGTNGNTNTDNNNNGGVLDDIGDDIENGIDDIGNDIKNDTDENGSSNNTNNNTNDNR